MSKRVAVNPKGTFIGMKKGNPPGLKQRCIEVADGCGRLGLSDFVDELNETTVPFQNRLKELEKMNKEKRGMPMAIAVEFQTILKFLKALDNKEWKR